MPGIPLSAKFSVVRIAGTASILWCRVWRIKPRTRWAPTPSFEGQGYMSQVACLRSATVTIELWFDEQQNPYELPFGLRDGNTATDVKLYLKTDTSPFWHLPEMSVEGPDQDHDVETEAKVVINGMSQGLFYYPVGQVATLPLGREGSEQELAQGV